MISMGVGWGSPLRGVFPLTVQEMTYVEAINTGYCGSQCAENNNGMIFYSMALCHLLEGNKN